MSKNKAVVRVAIKRTKRKGEQRYHFTIDKPGSASGETKREFYSREADAWRGARRILNARKLNVSNGYVGSKRSPAVWVCDIKGRTYDVIKVKA